MNPQDLPLTSVHTTNFPRILNELGISLLVSTYQAGKLIVVRADGATLNTHFRVFNKPMGMAVSGAKLAVGTAFQVWELRNVPAAAARLDPPGKHDACFLPRASHVTGDIDIHEMAYAGDELWFVNTRFSCLCTLDPAYSFVPRWRPPFISAYDLTDRCHLNGLALVDGIPRYVTALGETDTPAGWRANKANGGILMDIQSNRILVKGLSMPHSPRWYQNQLWVLESGQGSLARVDQASGQVQTVAQLPGFTRGIDFWGDLAFIGLSQIRETAVFSGLPLTERLTERICGVWVVHIQTGETLAFLRFEGGVQEIFAVQVLPGIRFPEVIDWDEGLLAGSYVLPDEALQQLAANPMQFENTPQFQLDQGNAAYHQGDLAGAEACYRRALELDPNFVPARFNWGVVCSDLDRWAEGTELLQAVIHADRDHADAWNQLGVIWAAQNQQVQASDCYRQAIRIQPDFAVAHLNLSMMLMKEGQLAEGFAEFEWRWRTPGFTPLNTAKPAWQGENSSEQSILLYTEQGAGDAIQFVRYVPLVAARCQRVLLVCPDYLSQLFATLPGIHRLIVADEPIPLEEFDCTAPLMSLPRLLGTTLETIPVDLPYLQVPESAVVALTPSTNLKVGIVWAGSPTHKADRHRSTRLVDWLPLLSKPGIEWYSLQIGSRTSDLAELPSRIRVQDLSPQIRDYGDTAAAIQQLDLVIGVDTSVIHLAGSLATPTWVLLSHVADWRWLLEIETNPWYPTMRVFRQPDPGNWAAVFDQVKEALTARIRG